MGRHDFVIVIPVADRPRQLADCLASLAELLRRHPYRGEVSVLIADDSLQPSSVERHRALAEEHTRAGLTTHHLDRAGQQALIDDLPDTLRARLGGVLGAKGADGAGRLGPSVQRNLALLWLARLPRDGRRRLFWFVDSDERFRLEVETGGGTQPYAPDYLHTLDHLFSTRPIQVLTGKVVGDPPVSPAVMARTLLDDVLAFFSALAETEPHAPCRFHANGHGDGQPESMNVAVSVPSPPAPPPEGEGSVERRSRDVPRIGQGDGQPESMNVAVSVPSPPAPPPEGEGSVERRSRDVHARVVRTGGAAYHDMADLFGYPVGAALPYRCPLAGPHDHVACLDHFAVGLGQFFDGVHPTRRSRYEAGQPLTLAPARTVYTGNYVLTEAALEWFIPFADLRLRMAGPTLGRLIEAALGEGFVSANLPLWHGRTLAELGRSECRPGVRHTAEGVDLSEEFARQYFGDVLLFTVESLVRLGYPDPALDAETIRRELAAVDARLHARYAQNLAAIAERIARLQETLEDADRWWRQEAAAQPAQAALARFLRELGRNLGPQAAPWQAIQAAATRTGRLDEMAKALLRHADERAAWREALGRA
jgi:hypothetical protein